MLLKKKKFCFVLMPFKEEMKEVYNDAIKPAIEQTGFTSLRVDELKGQFNIKGFAGYSDWRLPTLEEAMSLMEPEKKNDDLYIDTVFDSIQRWIWTSDVLQGESWAWVVSFNYGCCILHPFFSDISVRAVRFVQSSTE